MTNRTALLVALAACAPIEPLDLPTDPAVTGAPVGVRTEVHGDLHVEVWYPAAESARDAATESIDFRDFVPPGVAEALGDFELPTLPTVAVRNAEVRRTDAPFPIVLFSHGFGGTRTQSPDFTTHLASRGYVVLSTDHAGRSMPDLLPCLFSPPLEGCNLAFGGDDPAVDDIEALLELVDTLNDAQRGPFEGRLDVSTIGLSGHSAGGSTTASVGNVEARITALLPMASGAPITRDVPALRLAGTCDQTIRYDALTEQHATGSGDLLAVEGAGHLAFSDLCALELGTFADTYLSDRDDINELFLGQLVALGTDGCPGVRPARTRPECTEAFLPLEDSLPIVRHYATTFFDQALRGEGPGPQPDAYPNTSFEPSR